MDIKNKVVVITGGSKGLGKDIAQSLVKVGAQVVICARDEQGLAQAAAEVGAKGVVCDVRQEFQVQKLAQEVLGQFGRIDVWINNAGTWLPQAPIEETNWDRVHDMMEVNFFGTVYGSKAALVQMRKQDSGTIVNILSKSALDVRARSSGYGASKFAAMGFTKALVKEVEGTQIQVIAVYPGSMKTNFFDEKKPERFPEYMESDFVAVKIVENLMQENPTTELVVKKLGE